MGPNRRTSSGPARLATAVLVSAALHAVVVPALWFAPFSVSAPAAPVDITQAPTDAFTLRLDDPPRRAKPPAPRPKPPHSDLIQASFDVRLVDPAPGKPGAVRPAAATAGPDGDGPAPSSGVGDGPGDGAGPCALEVASAARSVVYVLDRSMSMGFHGALARARREVMASIRRLPPAVRFQIIAYNREAETLCDAPGLVPADPDAIRRAADAVAALRAAGGTDHGLALRRALALRPDVLFLLTDADDVSAEDVRTAARLNAGRAVIHTVELGGVARPDGPLHKLAADNGGVYRRIDPDE